MADGSHPPERQTQVTRRLLGAIDALERRGHEVKAVHIAVDGSMTVLTETPAAAVVAFTEGEDFDWVGRAGEKAVPGA